MQWRDRNDEAMRIARGQEAAALSMPVRVEVSLTGAPWIFRARLLEAGSDYCLLTLVDPCAPALRRGAAATLHIGALGTEECSIVGAIADVSPRPSGLTVRCAIDGDADGRALARVLPLAPKPAWTPDSL